MVKFKTAFATVCIIISGSACANDTITWDPHIRDGYKCSSAPNYCNISGSARIHIENTSDEDHSYNVHIGMTSDGGAPIGGAGQWSANITIPAHGVWDTNQTVAGYVKFNNRGQREIDIVGFTSGYQQFYQMQKGWIEAV